MAAMTRFLAEDVSWAAIASAEPYCLRLRSFMRAVCSFPKFVVWKPRTHLELRSMAGNTSLLYAFFAMTHLPLADSVTLFFLPRQLLDTPHCPGCSSKYAMTFGDVLAVGSGISGVVLIVQPQFLSTGIATFVAVLGSVAAAAAMIGLHRVRGVDTWAIVTHFSGVSSVVAVCCWLVVPDPLPLAEWRLKSFVVLGGIGVCGVLAQFCMSKAYVKGNPTWVGVAGLSQVVFAAGLDMLIWRRSFSPYAILGMLLITAPSAWLMTRRVDMRLEENTPDSVGEPLPVNDRCPICPIEEAGNVG